MKLIISRRCDMANKEVMQYLQSIKRAVPRKYGRYTLPAKTVKPILKGIDDDYQPVKKISYEGLDIFIKTFGRMHRSDPRRLRSKFTAEILLGRLYNSLGVNAATYYPIITTTGVFEKKEIEMMASQSILDIPGYKTTQAVADNKMQDVVSLLTNADKYSLEYMASHREDLAKMDPRFGDDKFFGEFMLMNLLDNLCLQEDRTLNNFYTYENKRTKDQGVIVYDNERTGLDKFFFSSSADFRKYLAGKGPVPFVPTTLCPVKEIGETYQSKLKGINQLLDSGVLGKAGEHFRKRLANLDYGELVADAERESGYPLWPDFVDRLGLLVSTAQSELCPQKTK